MSSAMRDSRVTVPRLPPRCVPRSRLLAALDDAASSPLTLLSAGPGAGKTVLLTDWVRRGRGTCRNGSCGTHTRESRTAFDMLALSPRAPDA